MPEVNDELPNPSTNNPYSITEETLQSRYSEVNKGRYITQMYAAITAGAGAISFGSVLGWSSTFIHDHDLDTLSGSQDVTEVMYAWIASLAALGCACGTPVWTWCSNSVGPRKGILLQSPLTICVWFLLAFSKRSSVLLVCRFFCGFFSMSYIICGELLLTDSVHIGNLTHLIVVFKASTYFGIFLTYIGGYYLHSDTLSTACAGVSALASFLLWFEPESPVFLYNKSEIKAENALIWYRGKTNIYTAMQNIKKDHDTRRLYSFQMNNHMLLAKVVLKALLIVTMLFIFKTSSGFYVLIFYSLLMFRDMNKIFSAYVDVIIFGASAFVCNLIFSMIHTHQPFGVRIPLIISSILVTISLITLSLYSYTETIHEWQFPNWILVVLMIALVISYNIGLSAYPDKILHDYMPFQIITRVKTFVTVAQWLFIFLMTNYAIILSEDLIVYYHWIFTILAIISTIGIFFICRYVIETKDKSLIQIQIQLGGTPVGTRAAYRYRLSHLTYM